MNNVKFLKAIIFLGSFHVGAAGAEVNPINGNFSLTFQDVGESDSPLQLRRTYNSLSSEVGWFGYGWGSVFEARLVTFADGTAAVRENGSGSFTFYGQASQKTSVQSAQILAAIAQQRESLRDTDKEKLVSEWAASPEKIARAAIKYGALNVSIGPTVLTTTRCAPGRLIEHHIGFLRTDCDGVVEHFSFGGQLLKRVFPSGEEITITTHGLERTIGERNGSAIKLVFNHLGVVETAVAPNKTTNFAHDGALNLVKTEELPSKYAMRFRYDSLHNMTAAAYIDSTKLQLKYGKDNKVSELIDRSGKKAVYVYP